MDPAGTVDPAELAQAVALDRVSPPGEMVLPLVVRIERIDPPSRTDALEAAAQAVLQMVTTGEPAWREAVRAWEGNRIRKVVRRARGAEWRRATELDGLTVVRATATVRVYPPIPLDGWPRELARLQVSGTDLDDPEVPPPVAAGTPLILLAPDLRMSTGKAMAQVGHAAQLGWQSLGPQERSAWQGRDFDLAVRDADRARWLAAVAADAPVVHDAGFTEIEPNSQTALFAGPA